MLSKNFASVWLLLRLSSVIEACMPESHNPMRWAIMEESMQLTSPNPLALNKRSSCGPAAGGASCPSSQCCSSGGVCGTGAFYCAAPDCLFPYGPACDANQVPTGTSTASVPRPLFGGVPYGVSITHCTVPGKVALTFDDGPYLYTSQLLDTLKGAGIHATFCVVANNGAKGQIELSSTGYPGIIQRMIAEGHQVASHTWSHQYLTNLTHQQRLDQFIKNEIALTDILGFFPTYLRPPYEAMNADVLTDLNSLGYHVLNYDVDTLDWQGDYTAAKNNFNNLVSAGNVKTSSFIVLSHDIHQQTVTDLVPYMISRVQALGYQFATAGECLGDPAMNWYRDPITGQPVSSSKLQAAVKAPQGANSTTILPTASASGNFGAGSSITPTAVKNSTTKANATSVTTMGLGSSSTSTFMFRFYCVIMTAMTLLT